MKLSDLKHGMVLKITRDVKNPKPDRRKVRDFAAEETWHAGERLYVEFYEYPTLRQGYGRVPSMREGFDELLDACELAPRNLDNILYSQTHGGTLVGYQDEILAVLVEFGKVSLDDVDAAIATIRQRELDEPDEV